jgi:RsiW-degrading membrane proteinase PrsW (M82 family)
MNFIQLFIYVFIVIALVEEICKWFFLYKISYNHNEFDSLYDMIVYASFVALGFACFENILYVSSSGIVTGLVRAVSAVPGHVCDGILMGSYLSLAKVNDLNGNMNLSRKYKILSILIPMITHGIYDYCLFTNNFIFIILFYIFVVIIYIITFKKIKRFSSINRKMKYRYNYCGICGTIVNSNYCPGCGRKNE